MPQHETQELVTRALRIRATDTEARTVTGVGVPWEETIEVWGERERFARGSVEAEGALLFYRHDEPIGRVSSSEDTEAGWEPLASFSSTRSAEDAYQLARDGVLTGLSVGFEPIEWHTVREEDGIDTIVYDRVRVREVSLVPFPAYPSAQVTQVRHKPTGKREEMTRTAAPAEGAQTTEAPDLEDLRHDMAEFRRSVETTIAGISTREREPEADGRSAGAFLRALVRGDEETVRCYNDLLQTRMYGEQLEERAYTGGTSADSPITPAFVGDLTRIFDASSGVLAQIFQSDTLPAEGMSVEYAQLKANTITVTEQANEGDDLPLGKVELEIKNAPVKTYGGAAELSRQKIERSSLPVLNRTLEALATAAGATKKAVLRAAFEALYAQRVAISSNGGVVVLGATLAAGTPQNWIDAAIDAAIRFDNEALEIEAFVTSASVFKKLSSLTETGNRVFTVDDERGQIGTLNVKGLNGDLVGIRTVLDPGLTGDKAAFVNGRAITQYDSALTQLQDENILNLSKAFSVYRYGAVAPEIPQAVVPVKLAAS